MAPLLRILLSFVAATYLNLVPVQAQDSDADEKSALIKFVENKISSENFKVSLNGLQGALSSNVSLDSITIADRRGVWLTIAEPKLVWSRTSLLVGKFDVESLTAKSVDVTRPPDPDTGAPAAETRPFALPELPVAVILEQLDIEAVSLDESVIGLAARVGVEGKLALDSGELDLDLRINRLDGRGGSLAAIAKFVSSNEQLTIDVQMSEPADGVFVNLVNVENKPPVSLKISGDGPLSNFDMNLEFDVDNRPILAGKLTVTAQTDAQSANGKRLKAHLSGPLASILPQKHREFFGSESQIATDILLRDDSMVDVDSLTVRTGNLDLDANARLLSDGFLSALNLDLSVLPDQGGKVRLPTGSVETLISALQMQVSYDAERQGGWTASLIANDFSRLGNEFSQASIVASGIVANATDAAQRSIEFATKGVVGGIRLSDADAGRALGDSIEFLGDGSWRANSALKFDGFQLNADAIQLATTGVLSGLNYEGTTDLEIQRLAAFSGLADRRLTGQAKLRVQGSTDLVFGGFELLLDGTASQISIGDPIADKLLDTQIGLSGTVSRNEEGLGFKKFRMGNTRFQTAIDGRYATGISDLRAVGEIFELAALSDQAAGPLQVTVSATGTNETHKVNAEIAMQRGSLRDRPVAGLSASFDGTIDPDWLRGQLSGSGQLGTDPFSLAGNLAVKLQSADARTAFTIEKMRAVIGASRLLADLSSDGTQSITGTVLIDSDDIGDVAALALVEASGSVNGRLDLIDTSGMQTVQADLQMRKMRFGDYSAASLDLVGSVVDLFGQPKVGATLSGQSIGAGEFEIVSVAGKIGTNGDISNFDLQAALAQFDTRIQTTGDVRYGANEMTVSVKTLSAQSQLANASLRSPATIALRSGQTVISNAALTVGEGSIVVDGTAGDNLNLDVSIDNLPLRIINAVQPRAGVSGTLSGEAELRGSSADPNIAFQFKGTDVIAGQLSSAGIDSLNLAASGGFAQNTVSLDSIQASNGQGLSLNGSGKIPLSGSGLDVKAQGNLPLQLASSVLASRGATVSGNARFDLSISGSISSPKPSGLVTVENGTLVDPLSNLKLVNIGLLAGLDGNRITVNRSSANLSGGGQLAATGSIGLDSDYPADLAISLRDARYTDGQTFSTELDGNLTVKGPLAADPTLGGTINIAKVEIAVPESMVSSSNLLAVKHVKPPPRAAATLSRMNQATPKARPTSRPSILRVNLTINAPNQIFVRGRGLDAELGGRVTLTGPVNNISPNGRFELRRGRLSIIGRRLNLDEGSITLSGDMNPVLNFVARTQVSDVEAYIAITGPVSDLEIRFYSNPELPEDEVLALIIFGRNLDSLSPAQIVRMATIAAELTGGSSPGLVDSIRRGNGLDDLDIVQDAQGNTSLKAGKYIADNIYLGVQAGQSSQEATINLDITNSIRAKGAVGSDGSSSIGIFLEKDY